MAVQDDAREDLMRELFGLIKPAGSGRGGVDAVLSFSNSVEIEFELKSTTKRDVTTARDLGPDHLQKWSGKHWLFGFFDSSGKVLQRCLYASPELMRPWLKKQEEYIRLDFALADLARSVAPALLENLLFLNFGDKAVYSVEDAFKVQKKQYTKAEYRQLQDLPAGYSKQKMVEILADRLNYIMRRGATLNNPHINGSYFSGWPPLFAVPVSIGAAIPSRTAKQAHRVLTDAVAKALPVPRPPTAET